MSEHEALLTALAAPVRQVLDRCGRIAVQRGDRAYLVGGSVRDLVLQRDSDDVDVVVVGDGMALAQALARAEGGTLTRHHAFQTATVQLPEAGRVDVATARSEVYERPGTLPLVEPGDLDADLARRDFTINMVAVALGPEESGRVHDPFGGREDMRAGVVRILHEQSFADDPTRLLRALRFAMRLGYRFDDVTARAFAAAVEGGYLESLTGRRLCREVGKLFEENGVDGPIRLDQEGLLAALHARLVADPERLRRLQDVERDAAEILARQPPALAPAWTRVLAMLAWPLQPQERWELSQRLRLSQQERRPLLESGPPWQRALAALREATPEAPPSRVVVALDPVAIEGLLVGMATLTGADAGLADLTGRYLREWRLTAPEMSGDDLLELGCPAGPRLGEVLARLRSARLDGEVSDLSEERELASQLLDQESN